MVFAFGGLDWLVFFRLFSGEVFAVVFSCFGGRFGEDFLVYSTFVFQDCRTYKEEEEEGFWGWGN